MDSDKVFYRIREAARYLSVSETQIKAWYKDGRLKYYRVAGQRRLVRFTKTDLDDFANANFERSE